MKKIRGGAGYGRAGVAAGKQEDGEFGAGGVEFKWLVPPLEEKGRMWRNLLLLLGSLRKYLNNYHAPSKPRDCERAGEDIP